jgi:hypothetical protein
MVDKRDGMGPSEHQIHHPYVLKNPRPMPVSEPVEGDIDAWLTKLEVYAPLDEDRKRDLDRWRMATTTERGEAFYGLLSVVAAMREYIRPKAPLVVRFPKPYHRPDA